MKKLTFTLLSACLALSASAQLSTYNYANAAGQSSGSSVIKSDTINSVQPNGGGIPSFAPAMNATWNLAGAQYQVDLSYRQYDTSTVALFNPAEYSNRVTYKLTPQLNYVSHLKFAITPAGMIGYGEHIDQQTYPIGLLTGNQNDILVINTQDVLYSTPVTFMPYPAVAGTTTWNTNLMTYNTNMTLTYTAEGYMAAPIVRKSRVTRTEEAVGYGTMKIKIPGTMMPGVPIQVIQVKSIMVTQDSFFQNNVPMPANVLATFNITQGQVSSVNQYAFYRAGEVTPMVTASYDSPAFTSLYDLIVHAQRVPMDMSVNNVKNDDRVSVYPNPATSHVNISVKDKNVSACQYQLMNIAAQVVAGGNITLNGGAGKVSLENTTAGMYFLRLSSNNEVIGESVLSVVK